MNTYCSMACSTKCFIHALFCTSKYITTCSHCTSNQHRLTSQLEQQQGNKVKIKRLQRGFENESVPELENESGPVLEKESGPELVIHVMLFNFLGLKSFIF